MQHDAGTEIFLLYRAQLRRLAYKMLGCAGLADEMVQETWLRWHQTDISRIESAKAWLITTLSRLCIDELRKLKRIKELYYGSWLPEPFFSELETDPADTTARAVDISMALMVILEQLTPEERIAFVLQDVFDHDYRAMAAIMDRTEASCRQLVHRARKKLAEGKPRYQVAEEVKSELLAKFATACLTGNIQELLSALAPEVCLISDGGGKIKAASKPVHGPRAVSRLVMGIRKIQPAGFYVMPASINDSLALAGYLADGQLYFTIRIEISPHGLSTIYLQNNPDKMKHINGQVA